MRQLSAPFFVTVLFSHDKKRHNISMMTLILNKKYHFVTFWTFWEINSRVVNINRYIYNLKIHSFVIKTFVQHMIEGVNKSRKKNLGLATQVLPGPISTLMNCFFVSISLLTKGIHTLGLLCWIKWYSLWYFFICVGDLTNCLESLTSTTSDSPSETTDMTTTQIPDG